MLLFTEYEVHSGTYPLRFTILTKVVSYKHRDDLRQKPSHVKQPDTRPHDIVPTSSIVVTRTPDKTVRRLPYFIHYSETPPLLWVMNESRQSDFSTMILYNHISPFTNNVVHQPHVHGTLSPNSTTTITIRTLLVRISTPYYRPLALCFSKSYRGTSVDSTPLWH